MKLKLFLLGISDEVEYVLPQSQKITRKTQNTITKTTIENEPLGKIRSHEFGNIEFKAYFKELKMVMLQFAFKELPNIKVISTNSFLNFET